MDFDGAKYVCSPPPRDADSQAAIWQGLRDGTFDIFSSDHCPFRIDATGEDTPARDRLSNTCRTAFRGRNPPADPVFRRRRQGRISLQRFVALTSTNPARLYGLYPQKGSIAIGADADLALWDPTLTRPIRQAQLNHGCDYTPYEGWRSPAGRSAPCCAAGPSRRTASRWAIPPGHLSRATSEAFA
ncbi:amidohydrolase family protein [Paracoccus marcusii]|uniref:amidohydrolase family protein n=1 Tax=Paracoccus marcusii TaxID=59779 RepID=UPI002ED41E4F|nr:amidohydrolase family protein [Paracoccus marcusii]